MSAQVPILPITSVAAPAAYLEGMEQLRGEIEAAMLLIAGNRLSALEECLWRQQVLCTGLKHLGGSLAAGPVEQPLMARLREASLALQEVNRTYAELVLQSGQSNNMLLRLCRSYKDAAPTPATPDEPRSWSCEA